MSLVSRVRAAEKRFFGDNWLTRERAPPKTFSGRTLLLAGLMVAAPLVFSGCGKNVNGNTGREWTEQDKFARDSLSQRMLYGYQDGKATLVKHGFRRIPDGTFFHHDYDHLVITLYGDKKDASREGGVRRAIIAQGPGIYESFAVESKYDSVFIGGDYDSIRIYDISYRQDMGFFTGTIWRESTLVYRCP